jgi:hypothetical protein
MKHYRYIGADDFLVGQTALGLEIDGVFKVQVDRFAHLWSHGWHETPRGDWREMDDNEEILT